MIDAQRVDEYIDLAQQSLNEAEGPDRAKWLDRLEQEYSNFRLVFNWLIDQGDPEKSLHLAYLLQELWFEEPHTGEARALFATLFDLVDREKYLPTAILARALDLAGSLALAQNDFVEARSLTQQAVEICRKLGNAADLGSRLIHLGHVERYAGNYRAAQALYQEAQQIFQALDNQWSLAVAIGNLGSTAVAAGDYETAAKLVKESLQRYRALNYEWDLAQTIGNAAGVAAGFGQFKRAMRLAGASAAHRARIGVSLPPIQNQRFEQMIVSARQALTEEIQKTLWAEGQAMTLDEAVEYALERKQKEKAMIKIQQLSQDNLQDVAHIDVAETGTQRYKVSDGQIQLFEQPWERSFWDAEAWPLRVKSWAEKLKPDLYLGAYAGARMVGIAGLRYQLTPRMAQLTSLYIDREHRRQGVAQQLMQEIFRLSQASGAQAIYVSSKPSIPAVGFYQRQGFRLTLQPHPHLFELQPLDIHMIKDLI
ncbi:MAG: GNAT family N-acetyltransferase [Caldilineaceae bacterium]